MLISFIIILLCIIAIGAVGDLFFNALGFSIRIFLSVVLIIASVYLIIKMSFVLVPWILILSIITLIIGIIWGIKSVVKRI